MTTLQDDLIRKLVSVADARAMLGGIGRMKLYELLARGDLSAVKLGRRTLLVEAEVAAFAARLPRGRFGACLRRATRAARARLIETHRRLADAS